MKKKIFTLLTLLLCAAGSVWGATVGDLVAISSDYTFIADNFTSNGTVGLTNGTLYDGGRFLPMGTQSTVSVAKNKGSVTFDGGSHLNSLRAKNEQDQYAIKVAGACKITFYTQSRTGRGITVGSTARSGNSGTSDTGCNEYGSQTASTTEWTCNITSAGVVYIASYGGDFYFAGFKVVFPNPSISTQPISASYALNAVATPLYVLAAASEGGGALSYQWYSCDDAEKSNPSAIGGATSGNYTPSTESTGTFYYYCKVSDSNGNKESNVATITVSAASAPTISVAPISPSVPQNTPSTLTADVTGVPVPTLQWYSCDDALKTNPVSLVGETAATYSPSTSVAGTYYFYAVATNSEGSATSNVVTLSVTPLNTVTFSLGSAVGVEGVVPAAKEVVSSITIPANQTLYKEGYTLTGWHDGENTYAAGDVVDISSNTTLTAVFEENTNSLGICSSNITWQFVTDNGAPIWTHEGDAAYFYVAQSKVGSEVIDVKMTMDASSGKINNGSFGDWCQMNSGTILTIPVVKGAVLKLYTMNEGTTNFGGNAGTYNSNIFTYTATTTGDLDINIGSGTWFRYLSVAYPVEGSKVYDFKTSVGTGVKETNTTKVSKTTQSINGASVDVIKMESSLKSDAKHYWKITPSAGIFKAGDRIAWTGCYSHSDSKTTTIAIFDDEDIESAIATGENFANVNGGTAVNPKVLTSGYFVLTVDAEALYIGRSGGTNTYLTELTVVRNQESGEISASGYNTFSTPCALDLSTISGGTAYVATAVDEGKVVLTKTTAKVPAGTGLMIAGTAGDDFTIDVIDETPDAPATNLLVGLPAGGEVAAANNSTEFNYVFGWSDAANPGFYKVTSDLPTLGAGKAYLHTTAALNAPSSARLSLSFGGETTGIETVQGEGLKVGGSQNYYNLNGQRVVAPQKGLYIINGKKVIVK